jgi:hypothetical protein
MAEGDTPGSAGVTDATIFDRLGPDGLGLFRIERRHC